MRTFVNVCILFFIGFLLVSSPVSGQVNGAPSSSGFVYDDCSCNRKLNLTIFNGLDGDYGGQEIDDDFEYDQGAITVANKNDSDGDGVIDNVDDAVRASPFGTEDIDLMKLIIDLEDGPPVSVQGCTATLVLPLGVNIWTSRIKDVSARADFDFMELPQTVWIEIPEVSQEPKDIVVSVNHIGEEHDVVRATAIWVEFETAYADRTSTPKPSADTDIDNSEMINHIENYTVSLDQSLYGFGTYKKDNPPFNDDLFNGGRVLFKFRVYPSDIVPLKDVYGVKFDLTRRKDKRDERMYQGSCDWQLDPRNEPFPLMEDETNDDPHMPPKAHDGLDEDKSPLDSDFPNIYSYDSPGNERLNLGTGNVIISTKRSTDFEEFARVSFKNELIGEGIQGSRISNKQSWSLNHTDALINNWVQIDKLRFEHNKLDIVSGLDVITNPCLLRGNGTGDVLITNVNFDNHPDYKRFEMLFDKPTGTWTLYGFHKNGCADVILGSDSNAQGGSWFLSTGVADITIVDDPTNPFDHLERLTFHRFKLEGLVNELKIE